MNRFIEFIKKLFFKDTLTLEEAKSTVEKNYLTQKEKFLNSIVVENTDDNILPLQIKIEQGIIDENQLDTMQIRKIKALYCSQITNLLSSINNYKLKLDKY